MQVQITCYVFGLWILHAPQPVEANGDPSGSPGGFFHREFSSLQLLCAHSGDLLGFLYNCVRVYSSSVKCLEMIVL